MESELVPLAAPLPRPLPRTGLTIRPGVPGDVPFMDALQKKHSKQVGWMPTAQFEGKIKLGHVLVAEDHGEVVGYCIGNDQYFKRDDVGIIYQMNVVPGRQRGLVGASLLRAQVERSAWGCKLYCCWCAQDIAANRFWEAMGFVPLAFRAGSEKKARTHIFWQKRIRQDDRETPWWFPSKTGAGSLREDRIVLPIPPGTHWSDAKPLIYPEVAAVTADQPRALPTPKTPRAKKQPPAAIVAPPAAVRRNGLTFDIPQPGEPLPEVVVANATPPKPPRAKGEKTDIRRVKRVCDARLVSAARELRDRWLEQVNGRSPDGRGPSPAPLIGCEKYEVSRAIAGPTAHSALTSVQIMTVRATHEVRCLPPGQMAA